jgi:hypothetical protein
MINGASCFSGCSSKPCDHNTRQRLICPARIGKRESPDRFSDGKAKVGLSMPPTDRLRKADFASAFKSIGRFKSWTEKYSSSVFQKYMFFSRHPALARGALRIVRSVESGMRWTC